MTCSASQEINENVYSVESEINTDEDKIQKLRTDFNHRKNEHFQLIQQCYPDIDTCPKMPNEDYLRLHNIKYTIVILAIYFNPTNTEKPYKKKHISLNDIRTAIQFPLVHGVKTAKNNDPEWENNDKILKIYKENPTIWERVLLQFENYLREKNPQDSLVGVYPHFGVHLTNDYSAEDWDSVDVLKTKYGRERLKISPFTTSLTKGLPKNISKYDPTLETLTYNTKYGMNEEVEFQSPPHWAFWDMNGYVYNCHLPPSVFPHDVLIQTYPIVIKNKKRTSLHPTNSYDQNSLVPYQSANIPTVQETEALLEIIATDVSFNEQKKWTEIGYILRFHYPFEEALGLFCDFSMMIDSLHKGDKFVAENWKKGGQDYHHFWLLRPNGTKTIKSLVFYAMNIDKDATLRIFPSLSFTKVFEDYSREENKENHNLVMKLGRRMVSEFSSATSANLYTICKTAKNHKYDEKLNKWYSLKPNNVWYSYTIANDMLWEIYDFIYPHLNDAIQKEWDIIKRLEKELAEMEAKTTQDYGSMEEEIGEMARKKAEEDFKKAQKSVKLQKKDLMKTISFMDRNIKQAGSTAFLRSVADLMKSKLKHNDFRDVLDKNKNIFAFDDYLIDFENGRNEWRLIQPEDYVYTTAGYKKPTWNESIQQELNGFYRQVFKENEAQIQYHLMTKASAVAGGNLQQEFYILTGEGSNGKGVDEDITKHAFGKYFISMNPGILTKASTGNEHSSLPRIIGKKFLWFNEPNCDAKLEVSVVKRLTGDNMDERPIYGESAEIFNQVVCYMVCNTIPAVSMRDDATMRRLKAIQFSVQFKDKEFIKKASEEEKTHLREKDTALRARLGGNPEYGHQIMLYLIELFIQHKMIEHRNFVVPPAFVITMENYLYDCNTALAFIMSNYDIDHTKTHNVPAEDVLKLYNKSDFGKERRLNSTQFGSYLKGIIPKERISFQEGNHQKKRTVYYLKKGGANEREMERDRSYADEQEAKEATPNPRLLVQTDHSSQGQPWVASGDHPLGNL